MVNQIIDPGFHHDLSKYRLTQIDNMSKATTEKYFSVNIQFLETKRNEIKALLNMVVVQQRNIKFNAIRLLSAKKLATELIKNLKEEYHIE